MESYAALITALSGAAVSLLAVWRQGKKVDRSDVHCQEKLDAVTDQLGELAMELSAVKRENAELRIKVAGLEAERDFRRDDGR